MSRRTQGLTSWLLQRGSAIFLAIFGLFLAFRLLQHIPENHLQVQALFANRFIAIGFVIFVVMLLAHAWIGMRDVIIDYVHSLATRLTVLSLLAVALMGCAIWAMAIIGVVL